MQAFLEENQSELPIRRRANVKDFRIHDLRPNFLLCSGFSAALRRMRGLGLGLILGITALLIAATAARPKR